MPASARFGSSARRRRASTSGGQYIAVTLDRGTVRIKSVGKALEGGSYGETIRVKNEATKDVYQVVLTGPQEGSVAPAAISRSRSFSSSTSSVPYPESSLAASATAVRAPFLPNIVTPSGVRLSSTSASFDVRSNKLTAS